MSAFADTSLTNRSFLFGVGTTWHLAGKAVLTLLRFQKPPFHRVTLEKVGGLSFRLDFAPQIDGDDHTDGIALCIRNILNIELFSKIRKEGNG